MLATSLAAASAIESLRCCSAVAELKFLASVRNETLL